MTAFSTLFNIIWVIFVGFISAIASFLIGLSCCLTIIGIPFGLQHFKFIKLVFAPAGKRVFTHFGKHPVMNVLWLIFGGFPAFVLYFALGVLFAVTVVGLPIAAQLFKIASFNLAPFGAEVVVAGEYTKDKNTLYDYDLLTKRIIANPDVVLSVNADNEASTVRSYLVANAARLEQEEKRILVDNPKYQSAGKISFGLSLLPILAVIYVMMNSSLGVVLGGVIIAAVSVVAVMVPYEIVTYLYCTKPLIACYAAQYRFLFEYYPVGSPCANSKILKYYTVTAQEQTLSGRTRVVRKSVRKSRISSILENIK